MDNKTIETISYLARLKLDDDKKEKITKDLENIINFVDELQDIIEISKDQASEMIMKAREHWFSN